MKKILVLAVISAVLFSGACYAQDDAKAPGPMTKLGRGVLNILDAVVEIPGTIMRETEAEGAATGMTKGTAKGIWNTIVRGFTGVYEVATFPIPVPDGYEPILDDPKFLSKQ